MLYTSINGKPLKDHKFPELKDFFVETIFMAFMDDGRRGMTDAIRSMVMTFADFLLTQSYAGAKVEKLTPLQETRLIDNSRKRIMTWFITQGSKGIDDGVTSAYTEIINEMRVAQ